MFKNDFNTQAKPSHVTSISYFKQLVNLCLNTSNFQLQISRLQSLAARSSIPSFRTASVLLTGHISMQKYQRQMLLLFETARASYLRTYWHAVNLTTCVSHTFLRVGRVQHMMGRFLRLLSVPDSMSLQGNIIWGMLVSQIRGRQRASLFLYVNNKSS